MSAISKIPKLYITIFILLNILDCVTTYIGLKMGLLEANFMLSKLFSVNIFLGLAVKMGLSIVAILLLTMIKKLKLLKIINLVFVGVIVWNLATVLILK